LLIITFLLLSKKFLLDNFLKFISDMTFSNESSSLEDNDLMEVAEAAAKNCTLRLEHIEALNITNNWTLIQR
jgi:hypothetical protein